MFAQDFNELGYLASQWPINPDIPTLLMVHGAGLNHSQWQKQMTGLKGHANMIAVDLPGHALSAHHDGNQSIIDYADTLSELVTELDSSQLIMAGHSMGGAVCLEFAMRHPTQVDGMILVNTGAKLRVQQDLLQQIHEDYPAFIRHLTNSALSKGTTPQVIEQFSELLMQSETEAVYNDFASCNSFDRLEDLNQIDCPALVISSDLDLMTPPKYGEFLADQLTQGQYTLIEGAAHISPMEKPEAVNHAILGFLQQFNGR
ncbi:alpha/beta fold hydrolase [Oceanospirillum linum]|uniref:AB hydrolase-1 domain-containing protein n=1 Tax=Oceanospirillum linum TaxID=966 RepID=A0A1T1H7T2_OCELI|nr:alpha/beta hydrolase [Oceanospirillum linum]OOV85939.1 hypothetical protein BTA35_0215620 [Oceanospirillum linum]SEG45526.1 Pimeloyl-ACP methyl ester carboxylesterase [Oleiphilus messinensis]SMP34621.1 Pimeloyl-ACP methyl ester carboxylesterase [Oceanospirillum linum]